MVAHIERHPFPKSLDLPLVLYLISQHDRPKEGGKQKISLQVVQSMATKDKSKEIKCKMEMWKKK